MSSTLQPAGPGELAAVALAAAWRRGERLPAEHYLEQHPELLDPPEGAVRLIYEELCLRQERGEEPTAEELLRRFPQWADELAVMLDWHRLMQAQLAPPHFPAAGETLGGFLLVAELGRGRQARVFLATQPTLADRPVVLKVTPRRDREFLSLARLQHTNIIPLYGVHDFPARNVRALCQPYLGGATLALLLKLLEPIPLARRTGQALVNALEQVGRSAALPTRGGPRAILAHVSYVEAICWMGACLADGLQYARERGLVHLDVKPSNLLLAADGQPLLLDFHLALHPVAAGQAAPHGLGGTPEYMSPEQQRAYAAVAHDKPIGDAVDGRSDLYSLARVLYVALGGAENLDGNSPPPLHRVNPRVSIGLSDVIHRCLAADAKERYPDAAAFAADLRRHLAHLPLRGVRNRSLVERWRNWRRRRPSAPLWLAVVLALAAAGLLLAREMTERFSDAQRALTDGQAQIERGAFAEATQTLTRGRARVADVPGGGRLVRDIDAQILLARRSQSANDLHAVAERLRFLAGADVYSSRDLQSLESHCRAAWDARATVIGQPPLDSRTEEQVKDDLLDLALFWSDLQRRLARQEDAKQLLADAEQLLGPSPALARERQRLAGVMPTAATPIPQSWWDHLSLGQSLLRSGDLERAAEHLQRAAELRPQDFWANFHGGVCAHRRGRFAEAVQFFGVAIALAPESAECHYNRGLANFAWGKHAAALRDYDRALALAPRLGAAALNRGILHYQDGRHSLAVADFEAALHNGAEPAAAHYNLALTQFAASNTTAARRQVEQALTHDPAHADAQALQKRLRSAK